MKIYTFDHKKTRRVLAGIIDGKTFIKRVKNNHFVRRYRGYGISKEVIEILLEKNIKNIQVITKNKSYLSKVEDWTRIEDDLGHGLQCFLSINFMSEINV